MLIFASSRSPFLLIAAEAGAILLLSRRVPPPVTPFSLLIAAAILLTAVLPVILRPAPEHALAACLGTVFASFLLIPFEPSLEEMLRNSSSPEMLSPYLGFRLVNGNLIGPLFFHLTHRFPKTGPASRAHLAAAYATPITLLALFALSTTPGAHRFWLAAMILVLFVLTALGMRQLLKVSRDPSPDNRRHAQQARLLLIALLFANSGILLRLALTLFTGVTITYNLALATEIFLPLGIAYAILKHDLFDIDAALRRALAYGALSLIVLALYLSLTLALTESLRRILEPFRTLAATLGVLIAALAFNPLQSRVQKAIDRLLYPDRLKFRQAIAATRAALSEVIERQEIIHLLTQTFPQAIGCAWGQLTLSPAPDVPRDFPSRPAWNAPLIVGGASLGRYWLGPRRAGPSFDRDEQAQLNALVGQAALALAYARTIEDLNTLNRELEQRVQQRSEQLLAQQRTLAVVAERQRLARDLHDSVNQTLFSINLSARAIRKRLPADTETALAELSALEQDARRALEEMRALLTQLRTPIETPLPSPRVDFSQQCRQKLDALAKRTGLQIEYTLPPALHLPAAQADEILAIIHEAMHNIARHSGTQQAACHVHRHNDRLQIVISDSGRGFDPPATLQQAGHYGLKGMQERAAALGGSLQIASRPGEGTTLTLDLPYPAEETS